MITLRFNVPVEAGIEQADLQGAADMLKAELESQTELGPPVAIALGGGRSLAGVAAAIAVAVPLIADAAKAVSAILGVIEKWQKMQREAGGPKAKLADIDPAAISVDVDGVLVALPDLTDEHLEKLAGK